MACAQAPHLDPRQSTKTFGAPLASSVAICSRTRVAAYVALTDIGDTHLNPFTADEIIDQFRLVASGRSVLLSTEMTCWLEGFAVQRMCKVQNCLSEYWSVSIANTWGLGTGCMLSWGANTDGRRHAHYS